MDGENVNNNQTTDQNQQGDGNQQTQQNSSNTTDQNQQQSSGKTFTQDDVNAIGAREKSQGKNSILKLFGCSDEKEAKAEAENYRKWKESQKTNEQKLADMEKQLKDSTSEAEQRAIAAENRLAALTAGISADSLDDALAIATLRVTEEKPLDKVLEEMKKEPKYSGFFKEESSSNGGTGSSADHNKGGQGNKGNIGERLAKNRIASAPQKSNFFKD